MSIIPLNGCDRCNRRVNGYASSMDDESGLRVTVFISKRTATIVGRNWKISRWPVGYRSRFLRSWAIHIRGGQRKTDQERERFLIGLVYYPIDPKRDENTALIRNILRCLRWCNQDIDAPVHGAALRRGFRCQRPIRPITDRSYAIFRQGFVGDQVCFNGLGPFL
jgi:hypothetical protein